MASPNPSKDHSTIEIPRPPIIYRVPTQVRGAVCRQPRVPTQVRGAEGIYEPILVSLGPFHHGLPQLRPIEDLKPEILGLLIPDVSKQEELTEKIQNVSDDIRTFYQGLSIQDDVALANMMLHDACFLIYCLKQMADHHHHDCDVLRRLGMSRLAFVVRDFFMLENQLPYFVIKMVIPYACEIDDDKAIDASFYDLVRSTMNYEKTPPQGGEFAHLLDCCRTILVGSNESKEAKIEKEKQESTMNREEKPPQGSKIARLLACCRTILVGNNESGEAKIEKEKKESTMNCEEKPPQGSKIDCRRTILVGNNQSGEAKIKKEKQEFKVVNSQFRSVMDLKAKGIHFRPTKSKSHKLTDIEFRSHSFYGMLRLPILLLESKTRVILSNIIAMEMSPGSGTDFAVTSYVKFMKSLIMKAEDVKELREKGILVTAWLADDEEVVRMFRELETEGACRRRDIFVGVRERINEHCRSKTKTFKAELLYTYFRSPWTTIALLAAVLLLCINCLNFMLNYHRFVRQLNRS